MLYDDYHPLTQQPPSSYGHHLLLEYNKTNVLSVWH